MNHEDTMKKLEEAYEIAKTNRDVRGCLDVIEAMKCESKAEGSNAE